MSALLPLPVAIPLATAAFLLLVGRLLPWHLPLWLAVMSALGVLGIDLALVGHTRIGYQRLESRDATLE